MLANHNSRNASGGGNHRIQGAHSAREKVGDTKR